LSGCNEKLELPRVLWLAGFLKLKAEVERDCSLGMADVITPGPPLLIQLQTCIFA